MLTTLQQWAAGQGNRLQVIPIGRLQDVRAEIADFREKEELNGFQQWITSGMYRFELPAAEFPIRSILLLAIPHPFYANVEFVSQGKMYPVVSLFKSNFDGAKQELAELLAAQGYHMQSAVNLPLKRLAVQSGLAVYGKNNVSFIDGMGSVFSYAAYFSDLECAADEWQAVRVAERCTHCLACYKNCPTGAIRKERFLINNEICLSNLNEGPGEFPAWLPRSVHHCLYDCLQCQIICPMNQDYIHNTIGPIRFSAEETELLLAGRRLETCPPEMQRKAKLLGMDEWWDNIPRNLRVLMEESDQQ